MKKILIIGKKSFIGSYLKNYLKKFYSKTFNIFSGGKEIDVFTDYSNRYPGAKISDWLKDNQNYFG